jgi:thiol-disulfide isomerase/thioredoxin
MTSPPTEGSPTEGAPTADASKQSALRKTLGWLIRFAVFAFIYVAISSWQNSDHVPEGKAAPGFTLSSLDGQSVSLEQYRGKSVLLHFWATWCGVCRQEFSMLNRLQQSLGDDAVLLTVVADSDNPELDAFVREQDIHYPVLKATPKLLAGYKVKAYPTNYFIAPDGTIASSSVGMSTEWASRARLSCAR